MTKLLQRCCKHSMKIRIAKFSQMKRPKPPNCRGSDSQGRQSNDAEGNYADAAGTYSLAKSLDPQDKDLAILQDDAECFAQKVQLQRKAQHDIEIGDYKMACEVCSQALALQPKNGLDFSPISYFMDNEIKKVMDRAKQS